MGKVRRLREKYHLSLKNEKEKESKPQPQIVDNNLETLSAVKLWSEPIQSSVPLPKESQGDGQPGIFAGIQIDTRNLVQRLPDFDAKSVASASSSHIGKLSRKSYLRPGEQQITKKEKQKRRKETFIQKIDSIMKAKAIIKDKKRRKSRPVIGDLNPLTEALPEVTDKPQPPVKPKRDQLDKRGTVPMKRLSNAKRHKQMLKDVNSFHLVLNDLYFMADPTSTIQDHLRNKLQSGSL